MKKVMMFVGAMAAAMLFAGCNCLDVSYELEVSKVASPIKIDGKCDDKAWSTVKSYPMLLTEDRYRDCFSNRPYFEGDVKIAYDDKNIYIIGKFMDDDIVQYGDDSTHLYLRGDTFEFFLHNPENGHYWEIYGSANGKSTVMFFENGGKRIFPEAIQLNDKVKVAVTMDGTLNNFKDTDKYFIVEMAIPLSIINSKGDSFKPGTQWNILCARYNYSKSLYDMELSCTSYMERANWHNRKAYLPVVFK